MMCWGRVELSAHPSQWPVAENQPCKIVTRETMTTTGLLIVDVAFEGIVVNVYLIMSLSLCTL